MNLGDGPPLEKCSDLDTIDVNDSTSHDLVSHSLCIGGQIIVIRQESNLIGAVEVNGKVIVGKSKVLILIPYDWYVLWLVDRY